MGPIETLAVLVAIAIATCLLVLLWSSFHPGPDRIKFGLAATFATYDVAIVLFFLILAWTNSW